MTSRLCCLLPAVVAFVALGPGPPPGDSLSSTDRAWIARALDAWQDVRENGLRIDDADPPWIVFFDTSGVWHVNGGRGAEAFAPAEGATVSTISLGAVEVPVVGWRHSGTLRLPDGSLTPPALITFAARTEPEGRAYLVCALPAIWRRDVHGLAPAQLEALPLGVFAHEMSHTRQASSLGARVTEIAEAQGLGDDFDDDVVQDRFGDLPGFRAAYLEERELFYRAAAEEDPELCRQLAEEATRLLLERRREFLDAESAFFAELEDLFLAMEGSANWVGYHVLLNAGLAKDEAAGLMRGGSQSWTQDEGLAIFLVLDALLPDWPRRVFASETVALSALLAEATEPR